MGYNAYNPGAVGLVQTASRDVGFADDGNPITFPEIKPGDLLLRAWFQVDVAFDDSGTDLVDFGWDTAVEGLAADLDVSSTGVVVASATAVKLPATRVFQAQYDGQNSNATVGAGKAIVEFVPQGE